MQTTTTQTSSVPNVTLWGGRISSALAALFLLFDSIIKVLSLSFAVEATTQLGYPTSAIVGIGILELACLVIYLVPRTAVLGAILFTGYLGGAVATHVRVGSDLFSMLFPLFIALLLWGGLYLRDPQIRRLLPLRS